jgi:hypothetical protein
VYLDGRDLSDMLIEAKLGRPYNTGNYASIRRHERATIREWLQVRFKEPALAEAFKQAFGMTWSLNFIHDLAMPFAFSSAMLVFAAFTSFLLAL